MLDRMFIFLSLGSYIAFSLIQFAIYMLDLLNSSVDCSDIIKLLGYNDNGGRRGST